MERLTANLDVSLKPNPAPYGCRLQRFPIVTQLTISWSNVICSLPGLNVCWQQPKSHDCKISPWYLSREWMSGDVCLKKTQRSYIKLMEKTKSPWTFSITTTIVVAVNMLILLLSSWSKAPTLTLQMQPDSILSISYSIEHFAYQRTEYKLPWWMFRKRSFCHFHGANMAHRKRIPLDDVIKHMKVIAAWIYNESKLKGNCTACNPKSSLWSWKYQKHDFWVTKSKRN